MLDTSQVLRFKINVHCEDFYKHTMIALFASRSSSVIERNIWASYSPISTSDDIKSQIQCHSIRIYSKE